MPEDPIDKRGKSPDAGRNRALRAIAVFKLAKAALLFAAGIGLLRLLHPDFAQRLTHWARSLAWSYDRGFLQSALGKLTGLDSRQLKALGAGAFLYAILFATEGIGLWFSRRWAEYLTLIATGSLLPFEIYELSRKLTVSRASALLINIVVVIYLGILERRRGN